MGQRPRFMAILFHRPAGNLWIQIHQAHENPASKTFT